MQLVQDLEATQAELEALEAPEQLRWANDHFGSGFAVTTSFADQHFHCHVIIFEKRPEDVLSRQFLMISSQCHCLRRT